MDIKVYYFQFLIQGVSGLLYPHEIPGYVGSRARGSIYSYYEIKYNTEFSMFKGEDSNLGLAKP